MKTSARLSAGTLASVSIQSIFSAKEEGGGGGGGRVFLSDCVRGKEEEERGDRRGG